MTTLIDDLLRSAEADLQQLIIDGVSESEVLDFKAGRYQGRSAEWSAGQEFAKDVAAMANHRGGVIVIGVREKGRVAVALTPIDDVDTELEQRKLRQWLGSFTSPIVDIQVKEVTSETTTGYYLIIGVPRSPQQPHAVLSSSNRRPLIYPVRDGQDTRYLTEHEVALRYSDRFRETFEAEAAFDRQIRASTDRLNSSPSVWVWLATRPLMPLMRRLDTTVANQIAEWWATNKIAGPLGSQVSAAHGIVGPGCVTFTNYRLRDDEDESDPRVSYLELHANGSSFVALDLLARTSDEDEGSRIGYFALIDGMIPMVDVAARWATETAGALGTASLSIGLFDSTQSPRPIELATEDFGELRRLHATRRLPSSGAFVTRDDTVADLAVCTEIHGRMALTHTCLSLLLQRFGRPEPEQIAPNGRIIFREWKYFSAVKAWADTHGIETVDGMASNLRLR
jgi:hypothetical protein